MDYRLEADFLSCSSCSAFNINSQCPHFKQAYKETCDQSFVVMPNIFPVPRLTAVEPCAVVVFTKSVASHRKHFILSSFLLRFRLKAKFPTGGMDGKVTYLSHRPNPTS